MFKVHTSSTVFKIDTKSITNGILMNTEVVSLFNSLIEDSGVAIELEVKDNLLESMLNLYLSYTCPAYGWLLPDNHKLYKAYKRSVRNITI